MTEDKINIEEIDSILREEALKIITDIGKTMEKYYENNEQYREKMIQWNHLLIRFLIVNSLTLSFQNDYCLSDIKDRLYENTELGINQVSASFNGYKKEKQ